VVGITRLTYGGSLVVTNIGTNALAAGDTLTLFSATNYSGSFASTNLPALTNGLGWKVSGLNSAGVIQVATYTNPPTILACASNRLVVTTSSTGLAPNFTADVSAVSESGIVHVTQLPPPGAAVPPGTNTVTLLVDDGYGNTNSCAALLVVDRAPLANTAAYTRQPLTTFKILTSSLLTNYTSDPDGDHVTLTGIGSPAHGSSALAGAWIAYTPGISDQTDSFNYSISDGRGGAATGAIQITLVSTSGGLIQSITPPGEGGVTITFAGIPGFPYTVQRASDPGGPWIGMHSTNAPPAGVFTYTDLSPPPISAYYRLIYQP